MADFTALKTTIQTYVKQNGNEEITGDILQEVLLAMVETMGDSAINDLVTDLSDEVTARQNAVQAIHDAIDNGYVYAGIATPTGTPVSGKVFYFAVTAGTYTNFGGLEVTQGINILKYNGSEWSVEQVVGIDDVPTAESDNLVKSGGIFKTSSQNIAYINTSFHLVKDTYFRQKIYGPFKAGTKIKLIISNYVFEGSGDRNINMHYQYNGTTKFFSVTYNPPTNKIVDSIFQDDTNVIEVQIAYTSSCTFCSADITVLYGSALVELADVTSNNDKGSQLDLALQNNAGTVENPNYRQIASLVLPSATGEKAGLMSASYKTKVDNSAKDISNIQETVGVNDTTFIDQNGQIDDFFYANVYTGFNKPFTKRCLLKSLKLCFYQATATNVGDVRTIVLGTIDQRNWLLVDKSYEVRVTSVNNNIVTFDLENIQAEIGQVLFIKVDKFSTSSAAACGISSASYDANMQILFTRDLNSALEIYASKGFSTYELKIIEIDSIFTTKEDLKPIEQSIAGLEDATNKINSYTDTVTGEPYKIKIVNGQIVAQLLNFQKILIIGHSFVTYGNTPSADWYLPNGQNRAMAPSVYDNEWAAFVAEKYDAQLTKMSGVDFERNYSPSYNFASNWNIQDEWDAICVYLCENANYNDTMQASWEAMLNYLKTAAPHAEIFCTASWSTGQKATAIAAACASVSDINYVNLIGINSDGSLSWNTGDYYIGRNDKYYPTGATYSHPSDIGHLVIADKFLESMGQLPFNNKTKNVVLNQSGGGTISIRNTEQVIGSVASIKCVADSGKYISGMTVTDANGNSVAATLRINGSDANNPNVYYTFIMPDTDVTITPVWSSTKNYTTYTTTISDTSGGNIKNLNAVCLAGTRCYIYVTPNSGKVLSSISASAGGSSLTLTVDGDRCYYFDMPDANVTITPVWGTA